MTAESTPPEQGAVAWGHSAAAHRVLGWCAMCDGRGYAKEAMAWRVRENKRYEEEQDARNVPAANPDDPEVRRG